MVFNQCAVAPWGALNDGQGCCGQHWPLSLFPSIPPLMPSRVSASQRLAWLFVAAALATSSPGEWCLWGWPGGAGCQELRRPQSKQASRSGSPASQSLSSCCWEVLGPCGAQEPSYITPCLQSRQPLTLYRTPSLVEYSLSLFSSPLYLGVLQAATAAAPGL